MAYNADGNYNNISDTSIIRMGLNWGNMQEISITTEGIQKNLKKFRPLDALCEYIWNGFDEYCEYEYSTSYKYSGGFSRFGLRMVIQKFIL